MRERLILSMMTIMLPCVAMCALPPSAESMRRFKAIAESPAIFEKISTTDQITGIHEGKEGYVVTTKQCKLYINIHETDLSQIEPNLVGPPKLEVVIRDMKCQKTKSPKSKKRANGR